MTRKIILITYTLLLYLFLLPGQTKIFGSYTFEKYINNPVIPIGQTWSAKYTHAPNVIIQDGLYKMWFSCHNGQFWQICFAYSYDAINWIQLQNNPVLKTNPDDNQEKHLHTPRVLYESGIYKMWYTASPDDASNWTIRYATSTNGTDWIRQGIAISPNLYSWDVDGVVYPFIIHENNIYKMWFTGFSNGIWKIGYATSGDGITWIKYPNNPIIDLSPNHADGASVIHTGTTYELYFHGINGDAYMTTSSDGITNWSAPVTVLTKGAPYDTNYIAGLSAIKLLSGTTLLYYGGNGSNGWQIHLATDGPIPSPFPTPTEIPTPTDVPTPTPTETAKKPIVLIPGIGGSWNKDAILHCKAAGYEGSWGEWPIANANVYNPLVSRLRNAGYPVYPYYYDWRRPIPSHTGQLTSFINANISAGTKALLIGHSMGGLVGLSYLESTQGTPIERMLLVATPLSGSVFAYPAWAGAELWINDTQLRIAFSVANAICTAKNKKLPTESVRTQFPSISYLLPTFSYLYTKHGPIDIQSMKTKNPWLPRSLSSPFHGVTLETLRGNGYKTLQQIEVSAVAPLSHLFSLWPDGKPTGKTKTADGDGTVLLSGSSIEHATDVIVPLEHTAIMYQETGIAAVTAFIEGVVPFSPFSVQKKDTIPIPLKKPESLTALVLLVDGAKATLTDITGISYPDTDGQITILEPQSSAYTATIVPTKRQATYTVTVIQLFADGSTKMKEYTRSDRNTKRFHLKFDRIHTSDDILYQF